MDRLAWKVSVVLFFVLLSLLSLDEFLNEFDPLLLARATVKPVSAVRPGLSEDFADISIADFDPNRYIAREVDGLALTILSERDSLIIIGRPLSGKSRLVWEVLKHFQDAIVVIPREDNPPEFSSNGLNERTVVLFIDDFHLVAPTFDLLAWKNRLNATEPRRLIVICTSRDGSDWKRVEEHQSRYLTEAGIACRVYSSRVGGHGEDLTRGQGQVLAGLLTSPLTESEFEQRFDGTPGSLTLDLKAMGQRYETLRAQGCGEAQACRLIDSIKLLHWSGQPRLLEGMARQVAESIRGNEPLSNETWDLLKERTEREGFGVFENQVFQTYRPYLEDPSCIPYEPSEDELQAMFAHLQQSNDFEGLFYLGVAAGELKNRRLELTAYRASASGGFAWAANNLGTALLADGLTVEAEQALRQAITLGADLAFGNLGLLLEKDETRTVEAEQAFRDGAAKGNADAALGLGNFLSDRPGRQFDAEVAYRQAIDLGQVQAKVNLGNLLLKMPGRVDEAERVYNEAVEDGTFRAYNSLGGLRAFQERFQEAEEYFRMGIERGIAECNLNLAEILAYNLNRPEEAEVAYLAATEANVSESRLRFGIFLSHQEGREPEAVAQLEQARNLGEIDAEGLHRLGLSLLRIPGRELDAEESLRSAFLAGDDLAVNSLGALFAEAEGREMQAELFFTTATIKAPTTAYRNLGILLARNPMRFADAERAFRDAIGSGDSSAYLNHGRLLLQDPTRRSEACSSLEHALAEGIEGAQELFNLECT